MTLEERSALLEKENAELKWQLEVQQKMIDVIASTLTFTPINLEGIFQKCNNYIEIFERDKEQQRERKRRMMETALALLASGIITFLILFLILFFCPPQ